MGHFDVKLQRSGVAKLDFWLIYAAKTYEDPGRLLIVSRDFGDSNIKLGDTQYPPLSKSPSSAIG